MIKKDGLYGLIDYSGNVLLPIQYTNLSFYYDGRNMINYQKGSDENSVYGIIKLDNMKEVFQSEVDSFYSVTDGILGRSYSDYSTGYRRYRTDIFNYAGHKLDTDEYISIEYTDGKFYGRKYMTDETLEELNIDVDFAVINLNGKYLDFDGVIRGDRTLVPMREIVEGLGGTVEWNGENQTVHAVIDGAEISLKINSDIMAVNARETALDVPAQIINDKTMLPLRAVAEAVGAQVDWDGQIRCVYINKDV